MDISLKGRLSAIVKNFRDEADPYSYYVYRFFLYAAFPLCLYWILKTPSPGIAIGALAGVGVLLALIGDKRILGHKFFWAIITLILLVIEVRAIHKDRQDQLDAHKVDLATQAAYYQGTLKTILETHESQMTQNQTHFDQTLGKMNTLADSSQIAINLSTETLNQATGGDSWIEMVPLRLGGPPLDQVGVDVRGKHPFYGDILEIYDASGLHRRKPTFPFPAFESLVVSMSLPTFYPGWGKPLRVSVPITNEKTQSYELRMIGKFTMEQEWISLYRTDAGTWSMAGEVHRGNKLLSKWADPDFPKDFKLQPPTLPLDPHLQPMNR